MFFSCENWTWAEWLVLFGIQAFLWFAADTIATIREQKKFKKVVDLMRKDLIRLERGFQ